MDNHEIEELEKKNRFKAVELLLEKLLELEKPVDWPELFLKSLKPQFLEVAEALRSLAERLKSDIFGDVTFGMREGGNEQGMRNILFYNK